MLNVEHERQLSWSSSFLTKSTCHGAPPQLAVNTRDCFPYRHGSCTVPSLTWVGNQRDTWSSPGHSVDYTWRVLSARRDTKQNDIKKENYWTKNLWRFEHRNPLLRLSPHWCASCSSVGGVFTWFTIVDTTESLGLSVEVEQLIECCWFGQWLFSKLSTELYYSQ